MERAIALMVGTRGQPVDLPGKGAFQIQAAEKSDVRKYQVNSMMRMALRMKLTNSSA
jgi:hypothetical protein